MTKERAETVGLAALAFLAGRPDDLERFLALAGIGPDELRRRAGDRDMLRAVTEFLLTDDRLVMEFCEFQSLDPQLLHLASHILSEP